MSDQKVSYVRFPDSITACDLPGNWLRMARTRERGATMGKIDVYYISPDKIRFRSKVKLEKFFGESLDLTNFDYQSGKWLTETSGAAKKRGRRSKKSVELAAASGPTPTTLSVDESVKLNASAAEFCKELLPKNIAKSTAAKALGKQTSDIPVGKKIEKISKKAVELAAASGPTPTTLSVNESAKLNASAAEFRKELLPKKIAKSTAAKALGKQTSDISVAKKIEKISKKSVELAAASGPTPTTLSVDESIKLNPSAAQFRKELLPQKFAKSTTAKASENQTSDIPAAKKNGKFSKKSVELAATSGPTPTTLSVNESFKLNPSAAQFCKELLPKKFTKPAAAKTFQSHAIGTFVERFKSPSPLHKGRHQPKSSQINSPFLLAAKTSKSKVDKKTGRKSKRDSDDFSMSISPPKLPRYSGAKKIRSYARKSDEKGQMRKVEEKTEKNVNAVIKTVTHKSVAVQTTDRLQCSPDEASGVVSLLRLKNDDEDADNELVIDRLINTLKEQLMASSSKHNKEQVSSEQFELQKLRVQVSKQQLLRLLKSN